LMGVYPQPFLRRMEPAVELTLKRIATMTATPVITNHDNAAK
jgi:hypothetical protein